MGIQISPAVRAVFFVVIAALILWYGVDYNKRTDERLAQEEAAALTEQRQNRLELLERIEREDVTVGEGPEAKWGDVLTAHYTGTFEDGTVFDSSHGRGEPIRFPFGQNAVILGWDLGLLGMKAGGVRKLVIPPELGYGPSGSGPIPPDTTLYFTVELLAINDEPAVSPDPSP